MSDFICSVCDSHPVLILDVLRLRCPVCARVVEQKDGIWAFTQDIYWGELSEERMKALLASIERDGFSIAIRNLQAQEPGAFQFAMDPARADWRFGMSLKPTDTVLDVGCGMGGNTFGLCDVVKEVIAFDLAWMRAKFVQQRALAEGKKNITVFAADFIDLPMREASVDVIVFNGILEWVGQSLKFDNPSEVQRWVLQKCFRMLKPGGRMYVGIENRFSFSYLLGPDHVGLRSIAWMPRWIARPYCRWRLGKDYRTYVYSKRGYERLFHEAGFADVRVLLPYPGYNDQRLLIPFSDVRFLRYAIANLMGNLNWKKRFVKWLSLIPGVLQVYRHFFFSYDIYGVKPPSNLPDVSSTRIKLHNGTGYRNPKVSFIKFEDGKPSVFQKTVRLPSDASVIERAFLALKRANGFGIPGIPKAISLVQEQGIFVSSESIMKGRALRYEDPTEVERAMIWLDVFSKRVVDGVYDVRALSDLLESTLLSMHSTDLEWLHEVRNIFDRFSGVLGNDFQLPRVPAHGDATPSNILCSKNGGIAVIDWDRFGDIAMPLFDLFTLAERCTPSGENPFLRYRVAILRQAAILNISEKAVPLLSVFYVLLSDWRKRERMFEWEPAVWDRDTLTLLRRQTEQVLAVFPL